MVYNITQSFGATAGTLYTLSAYAAEGSDGSTAAGCSLEICGDNTCGSSQALTNDYNKYLYGYNSALTESSAVATFMVQCPSSAYVALDNVTVTSNDGSSSAGQTATVTQYVTRTETVVQSQVQTQTQVVTAHVEDSVTKIYSFTTTISGSEVVITTTVS